MPNKRKQIEDSYNNRNKKYADKAESAWEALKGMLSDDKPKKKKKKKKKGSSKLSKAVQGWEDNK